MARHMENRGRHARDLVAALEAHPQVPGGPGDRFAGYGVLGVAFPSGDLLALRRFPASSVGTGYTSVWHRDRTGRWTFYQDIAPEFGCTRYFGREVDTVVVAPIRVLWTESNAFSVLVNGGRTIEWRVELGATIASRAFSVLAASAPHAVWARAAALPGVNRVVGATLGAGLVRMKGTTPDGYAFLAHPSGLWVVTASRAVLGGRDSGESQRLVSPLSLGEFVIPRRGLFVVARAYLQKRQGAHSPPVRLRDEGARGSSLNSV